MNRGNAEFTATRRRLLQALAAGSLLAGLPPLARAAAEARAWRNWSGSQQSAPRDIVFPGSEAELARLVAAAPGRVRPVGGSHSFSAVAATDGLMVSLEAMSGLAGHDPQQLTAALWAGTRVMSAGPLLQGIGQGLLNEADINLQSLGGAISTATHGTGAALQCLSANVRALRLVTADGSVLECSAQRDAELFDAVRVAIGSLGVISQVTLQNRAAYRLEETVQVGTTAEAMAALEREKDRHRHIEFFAFPHGGRAIVKRMNLSEAAATPAAAPMFDENELLDFAADLARRQAWLNAPLQKLVGLFVSDSRRVDDSFRVFPSPRSVRFNEMEYSVPAEHGLACFEEVVDTIRREDIPVFFPVEFRYVAADELWLSPFYRRAGAAISVHQYYKQDYRALFAAVEPVLRKYQGRPHWGKLHTLGRRELRELYPRYEDFLRRRAHLDPRGKFLNPHLQNLFGA